MQREARPLVDGFKGATHQSFRMREEAEGFVIRNRSASQATVEQRLEDEGPKKKVEPGMSKDVKLPADGSGNKGRVGNRKRYPRKKKETGVSDDLAEKMNNLEVKERRNVNVEVHITQM